MKKVSNFWVFMGFVSVLLVILEVATLLGGVVALLGVLVYSSEIISWIIASAVWGTWFFSRIINSWLMKKLDSLGI